MKLYSRLALSNVPRSSVMNPMSETGEGVSVEVHQDNNREFLEAYIPTSSFLFEIETHLRISILSDATLTSI